MAKIKVKVLLPFVSGKQSFGYGDETSLDQEVAYKYALKGVVEFSTKKAFEALDKEMKEKKAKEDEEQLQKEKELAKLTETESLTNERAKLQERVDAITDILEDAAVYYKSYIDLASDLEKLEG